MVSYWKTKDSVEAKVMKAPEGHYVMQMEGEKYPFPGYPRGNLLYGSLSPLKHLIKNKVFNESYGKSTEESIKQIKTGLKEVMQLIDTGKKADSDSIEMHPMQYDMVPFENLNPPVKEIWRAMTKIEENSHVIRKLKEILCFILQEDDAYRMRLQWICKFFNPNSLWRKILKRNPIEDFNLALSMLEHGEVIGDMKAKQRLFRVTIGTILKDPIVKSKFLELVKEIDWTKLKLTKADKYFFRAKYFKVDYPEYSY